MEEDQTMDFCGITQALWKSYFSLDRGEFESIFEWLDENCSIIGTGKHEFYLDRASFHQALMQEAEQREAVAFQFKDLWCRQRRLSLDVCLVYGGLDIWWEKEDKTVYIDMSSRYSILYHRIGGIWKVVHIYQSVPNVEQAPGEYYPKRLSDQVESARRLALRMEDLALRDGLTQLYNYRGLEKMWSTWDEAESWIFVADLDDFKSINDTYGHLAGNHVLKRISGRLRKTMRSGDVVCRMGGDEFVLLCGAVGGRAEAGHLAERIISEVKQEAGELRHPVSLSVGGVPISGGEPLECAVARADAVLYTVKRTTKDGYLLGT
ncbi:diguanylate cyclase [Intestinimonas butyriciproducens]|uniref:Diguanylate cyclase (GGDEF)-like protein n=1 Tax=Intestinimonas butyriciproducens TaxID=1297617 RepID=A0A2U1CF17_9FIRM|nr:diguanylate cyclase [Intestinimonas butyriciproducens]MCR1905038.1 diguanylate cyclase [Intestinimonas butyriciproducens]PVY59522.1 diguanylate cyclase (GGDEF)-like protein [Intestinimonas butyriciproducens]QBB64873.1 GGDEF domain [Intestinimonas butyriciproducens]